jgi:hypothetical protein
MREEFVAGRDFSQRYLGTYGWYTTDSNKKILVYIDNIDDYSMRFKDAKGGVYSANANKGVFFEFLPLNKGVYNSASRDDVLFVRRIPARQWSRGIHRNNTEILSLSGKIGTRVDFQSLGDIFLDTDRNKFIHDYMEGKRTCVALSDALCFIGGDVYIYNNPIGTVDKRTNKIVLTTDTFFQECMDAVVKFGLPMQVVVGN